MSVDNCEVKKSDLVIVGGGPAGLGLATLAKTELNISILLAERAAYFGGTPQSTFHLGFGMRDLHRLMSGPRYAKTLERRTRDQDITMKSGTDVLNWSPELVVDLAGENCRYNVQARALVLATGVRERSRHARLIAGDRGNGVYTTGALQRLVYQLGVNVGKRAVIVGAEHVSFTAIATLAHGGCKTVAVVTSEPHHQTFRPLKWLFASRRRIPIITNDDVNTIHGTERVTGVTLNSGTHIKCDTVIFTGDWIPEAELARLGGLDLREGSRAPEVDSLGRTRQPGVFAIGNAVHPAEPADICVLNARRSIGGLRSWLHDGSWPHSAVAIRTESPILFTWPSLVTSDDSDTNMLLRVARFIEQPTRFVVRQANTTIWSSKLRNKLVPNRSLRLPLTWANKVDPSGGDVEIVIEN